MKNPPRQRGGGLKKSVECSSDSLAVFYVEQVALNRHVSSKELSAGARGGEHSDFSRGGGGVCAAGDAVFHRERFVGDAAARAEGFLSGKIPFPLLHIDTSYKFPEMIEFRDRYAREIGAELIVHKNQEALDAGSESVCTWARRNAAAC
jgi:hypothetical protein